MLRLTTYAAALATLLEAVRASGGPGLSLELLRKESLAGLSPQAAAKVSDARICSCLHGEHAHTGGGPRRPLPLAGARPPLLPSRRYGGRG